MYENNDCMISHSVMNSTMRWPQVEDARKKAAVVCILCRCFFARLVTKDGRYGIRRIIAVIWIVIVVVIIVVMVVVVVVVGWQWWWGRSGGVDCNGGVGGSVSGGVGGGGW